MTFPDDLAHLIQTDRPLASMTWLGIGGPAHFYAEPTEPNDISRLIIAARENSMPVRTLGGGSNLLIRESGVDGLVLSLDAAIHSGIKIEGNLIHVGAGAKLNQLLISAVGHSLGGLEHLIGIPGTVGGAVVGNVSAGGRDIGSLVEKVKLINSDGLPQTIERSDLRFSHRKSSLGDRPITEVTFALQPGDSVALTKRMQKLWIACNSSRPSTDTRVVTPFVDPDGVPVRDLLQSVGMAGIREGAVLLDGNQPEYLVAESGATSDECLRLIDRVRQQVLLQSGIDLQLNLQIW